MSSQMEKYIRDIFSYQEVIYNSTLMNDYPETMDRIRKLFIEIENKNFADNKIYQIEAEIVESLVRGAFVNINTYDKERRQLKIVAVAGLVELVEYVFKFARIKLIGKNLPLEDKFAELSLLQCKLHRIPRGLKDAALKGFPDIIVDLIDEMIGPFFCYGAGFVYDNELVGNLAIIGRDIQIGPEKEEILNLLLPLFALVDMIHRSL